MRIGMRGLKRSSLKASGNYTGGEVQDFTRLALEIDKNSQYGC
jgi:hypothetical protein